MNRHLAMIGALLFSLFAGGCTSPARAPTLAIAIISPAAPPSAEQLATIDRLLQAQVARKGFVAARDARSADYVMHVRFTPDALNPARGHLEFIGIERNPTSNSPRPENSAAEASASTLADLRRVIAEVDAANARSN